MSNQACLSALKTTLNEIKTACPQVSTAFIFGKDKNLIAQDESTDENTIANAIEAFNTLNQKAHKTGGIESVTFRGTKKQTTITQVNNFYFATVASKEADEKTLKIITNVLVPTILKTIETLQPELANSVSEHAASSGNVMDERFGETEKLEIGFPTEETAVTEAEPESEPYLPQAPVSQFMVENLPGGFGNLLGSTDAVRVNSAVIAQWKSLYGDKKIEEVQVEEARTGKRLRCKFKPIKDQKYEGKGIIQIPEKMQASLQTKKGALVMVKPIIE
jgi:predicted regulator of Ras-like GTPase activity (Roadblock/LC7/MglB family)